MARGKFWVNNHAHVLAYNECANLRFLEFFIETIDVSKYVSGSAQPKLTQKQLNNIEVPTPPLDEQNVFAERVGIIEERYQLFKQSCESMQALFTSLQHCAFRGELTTSGLKEVAA
jgi:type I restriction enzyme S subunit